MDTDSFKTLTINNQSGDSENRSLVLFQTVVTPTKQILPAAWQVLSLSDPEPVHRLRIAEMLTISGRDDYGNHRPHQWALPGGSYGIESTTTGFELIRESEDPAKRAISFTHQLKGERYGAVLIRNSAPIAYSLLVGAGKAIEFEFDLVFHFMVSSKPVAGSQVLTPRQVKSKIHSLDLGAAEAGAEIKISGEGKSLKLQTV